jgi:TRAP-type mannitol/chloroaromatic compound transport system permease small subunit
LRKVLRVIDSISGYTGGFVKWICYVLILVVIFDVVARYVFNEPTIWGYDTSLMIGAALYSLAFCYTQRYRSHVRVDVLYTHLSQRKKAVVDALGTLLVHLPLIGLLTYESWKWAVKAWVIQERMVETYWYPPAGPVRTVVAIAFALLFFQLIAELVRQGYFALKGVSYES